MRADDAAAADDAEEEQEEVAEAEAEEVEVEAEADAEAAAAYEEAEEEEGRRRRRNNFPETSPPIPSHPGMKYPVRASPSLRCTVVLLFVRALHSSPVGSSGSKLWLQTLTPRSDRGPKLTK